MGWFGSDPDKDATARNKREAKKGLKATERGSEARKEARKVYKMTKKEHVGFIKQLRKAGGQYAVDHSTGRIKNMKAYNAVPEFYRRIRNGRCPHCNLTVKRSGFVCDACKGAVPSDEVLDKHFESMQTHTPSGKPIAGLTPGDPEWGVYWGPGGVRDR